MFARKDALKFNTRHWSDAYVVSKIIQLPFNPLSLMNRKKIFWSAFASVLCACAVGTYFASREASVDSNNTSKAKTLAAQTGKTERGMQVQGNRSGGNDPTLLRREPCEPDFSEQLAWAESGELPQKGEVFSLRFFDDKAFDFHVEKAQRRLINGKSIISVSGRTREDGLQVASFIVSEGKVRTTINDFENSRLYSIAYDFTRGQYFSSEQDTTKTPECGTCKGHACSHAAHADAPVLSESDVAEFKTKIALGDETKRYIVDYLVVYDTTGRDYAQGHGGTEVLAADAVVQMNNCFDNSKIDAAYRLAGTEVLEDYTSDGDFYKALDNITPGTSGNAEIQQEVSEFREFYGADLVQLYHMGTGVAGLGWAPGNGAVKERMFSVVGANYATGATSAHEAGHNMGCQHSREQTSSPGRHDYAVGANRKTPGNTLYNGHKQYYHTVMSYGISWPSEDGPWNDNTTRAPIFSGPNAVWDGVTLGSDTEDNCRMLNDSVPRAADFFTPGLFPVSSVDFESNGGTQNLRLDTTYKWALTIKDAPWVTVDQDEGEGSATLTLTAEANPYCVPRTGTLAAEVVRSNGDTFIFEIEVTQEPTDPVMNLTSEFAGELANTGEGKYLTIVPKEGAEKVFTIETTWPGLAARSSATWITATVNMTTKKLELVAGKNETIDERKAEVKLYYTGDSKNPVGTLTIIQEPGDPFVRVNGDNVINLGNEAGEKRISIRSNTQWKLEVGDDCADWIEILRKNDDFTEGNAAVTLAYKENLSLSPRKGNLAVTFLHSDGYKERVVLSEKVLQKKGQSFIRLDKESLSLSYGVASETIRLSSNGDWEVVESTCPNWIMLSALSGSAGNEIPLVLSVSENDDPDSPRTANIKFRANGKTTDLSITQGIRQTIVADVLKLVFPAEGGERTMKLRATGIWKLVYSPKWVTVEAQGGNAPDGNMMDFVVKTTGPNTSGEKLTGAITFECGETRLQVQLEQERAYEAPKPDEPAKEAGFEAFDYADAYLVFNADGGEDVVQLGFMPEESQVVFSLDSEWIDCALDATELYVLVSPNLQGKSRETWIFVLTEKGDLHAIPVKQEK